MKKILFTLLLLSNYGFSQCVIDGTTVTGTTKAKVVKSCDVVVQSLSDGIVKSSGDSLKTATNADLPVMTSTVGGAVPTPPNNTTTFLRGDGTFAIPSGGAPSDAAYGAGWDGVTTTAPSKNSVYDKIETLVQKQTGTVLFANPSSSVLNITSDNGALAKSLVSIDNSAMTVGYNLAGGGSFLQMDGSGATIQSNGTGINIQNTGAAIVLNSDVGVGVVAPYLSLQTTASVANLKATNVTAPIDIECQNGSGTMAYLADIPSVSGVYLPLAGGTLTGNLTVQGQLDMQYYSLKDVSVIDNTASSLSIISDGVALNNISNIFSHPSKVSQYYFPYVNTLVDSLLTIRSAATLINKSISGSTNTLSNIAQASVTNLTSDLAAKQATLVSATNIKTVNGNSLLGSGDLVLGGTGTVTNASVVSANGFSGSVATSTTTPAITIETSVVGLLKGNGTGVSAAVVGTDYARAVTIASNGTDANYTAVVNTIKYLPAGTLTANRTITLPAGMNGDVLEIYNNESSYSWLLGGAGAYLADRTTLVTELYYNVPTFMKVIGGLWIITN